MDKKIRLPKDEFIDGQDVEGHRRPPADGATPRGESLRPFEATPRGESATPRGESLEDDVEGHRTPRGESVVFRFDGTPGGEGATPRGESATPRGESLEDEDVEGHRMAPPGNVDADDFTILPAPPSIGLRRTPGHGGE